MPGPGLCCCAPPGATQCIRVRVCGYGDGNLSPRYLVPPGTVIKLVGGGNTYSQTVGQTYSGYTFSGSSTTCFVVPKGSYTLTITPPTGSNYAPSSQTITVGANNPLVVVNLAPVSGYSCSGDPCFPECAGGPPYQIVTPPQTLYLSDGQGAFPVTMTTDLPAGVSFYASGLYNWLGTASRLASSATGNDPSSGFCTTQTNIVVPVTFLVSCGGSVNAGAGDLTVNLFADDCRQPAQGGNQCVAASQGSAGGAPVWGNRFPGINGGTCPKIWCGSGGLNISGCLPGSITGTGSAGWSDHNCQSSQPYTNPLSSIQGYGCGINLGMTS